VTYRGSAALAVPITGATAALFEYITNSKILLSSLSSSPSHTHIKALLKLLSLQKHQIHGILSDYTATNTNGSVSDLAYFNTKSFTDHSFVQLDWAIYSNH